MASKWVGRWARWSRCGCAEFIVLLTVLVCENVCFFLPNPCAVNTHILASQFVFLSFYAHYKLL